MNKSLALTGTPRHLNAKARAARLTLLAGLLATPLLAAPLATQAEVSIGIGITIAPPALPVYAQPAAPAPGYIWTPGHWAWGPDGYYWVDGVWLMPPAIGMLWTPGWWGWSDGYYRWHGGYWGPQVGFYGGINYGFGYFGDGYVGGGWRGNHFYYNRAVTNVNVTKVRNVYVDKTVIHNDRRNDQRNRISYNGGHDGRHAAPSTEQRVYAERRHQTLPQNVGRHDKAAPNTQRPNTPSSNRGANDQQPRFDTSARQDANHPGQPRSPGSSANEGHGKQRHEGRPPEARRASPSFGGAPERPRMETRPAAAPERPRQDIRQQEFRPPRAEAPARQERHGAEHPGNRGEGHGRQGRNDR